MSMSVATGICLIVMAILSGGGFIAVLATWITWNDYQIILFPVLPILGLACIILVIISKIMPRKS